MIIFLNDRIAVSVRGPPTVSRSNCNQRLRLYKNKNPGTGAATPFGPWRQGTEHGSGPSIPLLEHSVNYRRRAPTGGWSGQP
jgi:hypothetical protein